MSKYKMLIEDPVSGLWGDAQAPPFGSLTELYMCAMLWYPDHQAGFLVVEDENAPG